MWSALGYHASARAANEGPPFGGPSDSSTRQPVVRNREQPAPRLRLQDLTPRLVKKAGSSSVIWVMLDELEMLYRERLQDYTRAAAAIVGDEDSGRDAVQDAFTNAVRKRRRFRGDGSLEAWVLRIVVNAARDARRRRFRNAESPEHITTRAEALGLPLELLTDRQREVLFLHYYADLDYATIAHALGISSGAVGATLSAARQTLRSALTKEVAR